MQSSQITYVEGSPTVVTVFHDGSLHTAIAEHHPNFQAIIVALGNGTADTEVIDLFDVQRAVNRKFERLSTRVSAKDGVVFFDGDPVHNALTEQVLRFLNEGVEDWKPLVAFFDNVMQNPNENSREQLFEWLANDESLTITDTGLIVGYKGCNLNDEGVAVSTREAPASEQVTVDDVQVTGYVPNVPGTVVAMPRSIVDPDEDTYCSVGLHVGTFRYANSFASKVLQVHVNPRDVVSVTSDSNREKIRTCRYEVVAVADRKIESPLYSTYVAEDYDESEDEDDAAECQGCFDLVDEVNDEGYCIECAVEIAQEEAADEVHSTWDTRLNHTRQQRYPAGHAKAGQFIPKV